MKRFTLIAMVFALVLAFAGLASAAELKVRGQVQAWGSATDNWDFVKTGTTRNTNYGYEDDFTIEERARLFFDFVANKDLKFVLQIQIGNGKWGQDGLGLGQGDARTNSSTSLRTRQAYLDFNVPDTTVNAKVGYMTVTLPGNAGSGILDDEVAALLVSTPIIDKTLSVLVGYARLMDGTNANNTNNAAGTGFNSYGMRDEFDAAILALPVKLDGVEATPFFVYGWGGKDSLNDAFSGYAGTSSFSSSDTGRLNGLLSPSVRAMGVNPLRYQKDISAWWTGFAAKVTMFDPIWAAVDFNYGQLNGGGSLDSDAGGVYDNKSVNDRHGYLVDLIVGYNGLDMVKPKVWFAYSSGEDKDPTNGSERMPSLSAQLKYTPFWFANDISSSTGSMCAYTAANYDRSGFVAAGLTLEKITFMDKLFHDFYFAWIKGTNSKDLLTDPNIGRTGGFSASGGMNALSYKPGQFLTTKDTLYELDLNTTYKVYEELSAVVEFGYIIQSLDKDTWNTYYGMTGAGDNTFKFSNAFKAMFGLSYDF